MIKASAQKELSKEILSLKINYGGPELIRGLERELAARLEGMLIYCGIFLADEKKVGDLLRACQTAVLQKKSVVSLPEITDQTRQGDLEKLIAVVTPGKFAELLQTAQAQNQAVNLRTALENIFSRLSDREVRYVVTRSATAARQAQAVVTFPEITNSEYREIFSTLAEFHGLAVWAAATQAAQDNIIQAKISHHIIAESDQTDSSYVALVAALAHRIKTAAQQRER